MGPLVVVEVINPVLYRVRDRKREYVLHHDLLKRCEDRAIPLWLRKIRHELMDLDTTIAYDEAEQEDEPSPSNLGIPPGGGDVTSSSGPIEDEISRQSDPEESVDIIDVAVPSDEVTNSAGAINTPEGSMATGGPDQGDGVKANVSWIDHAKDLGLKTLFSESPTRHIYAQTG